MENKAGGTRPPPLNSQASIFLWIGQDWSTSRKKLTHPFKERTGWREESEVLVCCLAKVCYVLLGIS